MLSKTAENLYWTSRYIERADSIARLLEVAYRINLIPNSSRVHNEWTSIPVSYTHLTLPTSPHV